IYIIYFLLPASIGLAILGKPIIRTLFERGSFTYEATLMTYSCLIYYSLGLVFFSISKIFISSFYAMKKTYIPVKIAAICVVINLFLNIILMQYLEVGGLALATTITSVLSCWLLYKNLKLNIEIKIFNSEMQKFLLKIFVANFTMFLSILIIRIYFHNIFIVTFFGVMSGSIIYFLSSKILKIEETSLFITLFTKLIKTAN
ncbi:MAG: lipid II flippase MurJ, partial [Endomicrobiia bacterium]